MPVSVAITSNRLFKQCEASPIAVIGNVRSTAETLSENPSIEATERYWLASSNFARHIEAIRSYPVRAISEQSEVSKSAIAIHALAHQIRQDLVELQHKRTRVFSDQALAQTLPRLRSKLPSWLQDGNLALAEFSRLPKNWDGDGAEPPNLVSREWSRVILEILLELNFAPTRVTPSVENGIGISFIKGEKYADIECFNTGEILAVTSYGQENPPVWEVACNREALKSALERIQLFLHSESTPENV
jgi:hypothetical protein